MQGRRKSLNLYGPKGLSEIITLQLKHSETVFNYELNFHAVDTTVNQVIHEDEFIRVRENDLRFLVNLDDYLDTGLFLDHRDVRSMVGDMSKGKDMLNLFAYTGSATVYAAARGAKSTTTVDLSKNYLQWARRNLELNNLAGSNHYFDAADCLTWLNRTRETFDVIFVDPPSFSNSKRLDDDFDVQRDHVSLLKACKARLRKGGQIVFSNNLRSFKLADAVKKLGFASVDNITRKTLPKDYERNTKIHQVYLLKG